jgi:hypothetical protein
MLMISAAYERGWRRRTLDLSLPRARRRGEVPEPPTTEHRHMPQPITPTGGSVPHKPLWSTASSHASFGRHVRGHGQRAHRTGPLLSCRSTCRAPHEGVA